MADKKEYIERGALIAECEKKHITILSNETPFDAIRKMGKEFKKCVYEAPAADVVRLGMGSGRLLLAVMAKRKWSVLIADTNRI